MSDIEQDREVFPLQILRPPSVQKVIAETSKLLGEMRVDRMSAHSSARPDPHESVLAAPERADTPTPEGAHTHQLQRKSYHQAQKKPITLIRRTSHYIPIG
jgi:hypothetical protein